MAFNMKPQVVSILIVAFMFALYSANGVSCQEGESSSVEKKETTTADKHPQGGLPVFVVRQNQGAQSGSGSGNKPDIYLGWLNWEGMKPFKPFMGPFVQQIQPYSQELSGMFLNTIPGAQSIYSQVDQMGNQFSNFNPFSQLMSSFGGGSSSSSGGGSGGGLSSLFQNGRRR